jgi:ketosteroid isomerase-like protein
MSKEFWWSAQKIGWLRIALAAALIAMISTAAWGQNNKKKKNANNNEQAVPNDSLPDTDQIEHNIGEMLAAFQMGNADDMHKYYSDNATFVRSGSFDPPLVGYQSYATDYKASWSTFQGMQVVRKNTLIVTHADTAYATYQWQFLATLGGKPFSAMGDTTLVLNKVAGNWLIVHNHTSQICTATAPAQPSAPVPATAQPGGSAPHAPGL